MCSNKEAGFSFIAKVNYRPQRKAPQDANSWHVIIQILLPGALYV